MDTIKYQVVNADNQVIRLLQLGKVDRKVATAKVARLYGEAAPFLKIELITNKTYKILKEMGVKG